MNRHPPITPITVACPTCKASVGGSCYEPVRMHGNSVSGAVRLVSYHHAARVDLAMRMNWNASPLPPQSLFDRVVTFIARRLLA